MSRSYEKEQEYLEGLWQDLLSDEEDDPFADAGSSDDYVPSDDSSAGAESIVIKRKCGKSNAGNILIFIFDSRKALEYKKRKTEGQPCSSSLPTTSANEKIARNNGKLPLSKRRGLRLTTKICPSSSQPTNDQSHDDTLLSETDEDDLTTSEEDDQVPSNFATMNQVIDEVIQDAPTSATDDDDEVAEITVISACAQEMTRRSHTNKRIQIISDSQAAPKALGAVEIHSQVVKDHMDSLTKLAEHNSITLKWMRGHQGHEGNEKADFLAKKGVEVPLIGPEPTCGLAYRTARRVMKDLLREKHISHWAKVPGLRHSRKGVGEEEETSLHILCECPALAAARYSNFGAIIIEPKEVTDAPLETVLKFLKETVLIE
ncbi:hypothetical protein NQ318_015735 [Aromia moschata]|uniref:RNase H type-1 domain-containing protein n=1 Tax=Aromia moschata TaxID=1265417 RepID=A0AAV8Y1Z9_9CUCU|nr:hypothetical protein NQ318_015735 [Aromia moschata]